MLLDDTWLLVPNARDFRIFSCMSKTVSIKFYILFCFYISCIPKVFLKETLMFFGECVLVARAVF